MMSRKSCLHAQCSGVRPPSCQCHQQHPQSVPAFTTVDTMRSWRSVPDVEHTDIETADARPRCDYPAPQLLSTGVHTHNTQQCCDSYHVASVDRHRPCLQQLLDAVEVPMTHSVPHAKLRPSKTTRRHGSHTRNTAHMDTRLS